MIWHATMVRIRTRVVSEALSMMVLAMVGWVAVDLDPSQLHCSNNLLLLENSSHQFKSAQSRHNIERQIL